MGPRVVLNSWIAIGIMAVGTSSAQMPIDDSNLADTVSGLADEYVREFSRSFPFSIMYSELPLESQSTVDISTPADIARWREFVKSIETRLDRIPESEIADRTEWVTRAFLTHGIAEARTNEICRWELWGVGRFGWPFELAVIADTQPVATSAEQEFALERWRKLGGWIDQETANLAEGLNQGYSAYKLSVEANIAQVDAWIALPEDQWATTALANRVNDAEFSKKMTEIATNSLIPAARRYRDFLANEYLSKARVSPSIVKMPRGLECFQAKLAVSTSVDIDPRSMLDILIARREAERTRILELATLHYGEQELDWVKLSFLLRNDPRDTFRDAEEIRETLTAVINRGRAILPSMVETTLSGEIALKPVPEHAVGTIPQGRYSLASADGTRPPTFHYNADPTKFRGVIAESLTIHETIPGHYLQFEVARLNQMEELHSITKIVFVPGSTEGWATYAEQWAVELELYSSAFDEMGGLINSLTWSAIADLGMQIDDWSLEQAEVYLREEWPFDLEGLERQWVADIASMPGRYERYTIGALQFQAARERAENALGDGFDSRLFHQMLLSDGPLPFTFLNMKVDNWIESRQ